MGSVPTSTFVSKGHCSFLFHTNVPLLVSGRFFRDSLNTTVDFQLLLPKRQIGCSASGRWPFNDVWGHWIFCSFFQIYVACFYKIFTTYSRTRTLQLLGGLPTGTFQWDMQHNKNDLTDILAYLIWTFSFVLYSFFSEWWSKVIWKYLSSSDVFESKCFNAWL